MTTELRYAILAAADHIERNPDSYHFHETLIPRQEGQRGCALGWIGYYLGIRGWFSRRKINRASSRLGVGDVCFYDRISRIGITSTAWTRDARECAERLRRYANCHHPLPGTPKSARDFFTDEPITK